MARPEGFEYSVAFETTNDTVFEPFHIDRRDDLSEADLTALAGHDFDDVKVLGFYVQPMSAGYAFGERRKVAS